jgi:lactate racemase
VDAATGLRTGAWYGDTSLEVRIPEAWRVTTLWPDTPPPLSDDQIAEALERPAGQPPVKELARGKSRPLVIVDDLTRPTPVSRVMPHLLRHFAAAGIEASDVTILMASGAHASSGAEALVKKVGPEAGSSCRMLEHDYTQNLVRVGRTSFGTPVLVNREVAAADFVVGVGGVYPQNSTGFGGGSKLALGVLGRRSIVGLHYGHPSMGGSYRIDNDFRRDLDEIARMIGLHTTIALHVDANREAVRMVSGDHDVYYREAVAFSMQKYRAPLPGQADVVISNAYPIDVSLTMMRIKGIIPLLHAKPGASRILVSACPEGLGHHDLFPFVREPRFARQRHMARSAIARPRAVPGKAASLVGRGIARMRSRPGGTAAGPTAGGATNPIWLYVPKDSAPGLPSEIPQMRLIDSWEAVLENVSREQGSGNEPAVTVYPCAPLHVLDLPQVAESAVGPEGAALAD